jgi:hypothetical protein
VEVCRKHTARLEARLTDCSWLFVRRPELSVTPSGESAILIEKDNTGNEYPQSPSKRGNRRSGYRDGLGRIGWIRGSTADSSIRGRIGCWGLAATFSITRNVRS